VGGAREGVMVMGFHGHFFHPHLASPIKGRKYFCNFGKLVIKSPFEEATRGHPLCGWSQIFRPDFSKTI